MCLRPQPLRFTTIPAFVSCMLDHLEDMPILNMIFGQSGTAAPSPKPLVKRRASPLKESPARDEEGETSACPMEQVVDENPSASQQPYNVNMEQVDYDRDTDNDDDLDDEEQPPAGNPKPKAMPHPKLVPKSPPPTLRLVSKVKPAPKNILDEETESDNNPGERPARQCGQLSHPTIGGMCQKNQIPASASRGHPYIQDLSEILDSSTSCLNTTRSALPSSTRFHFTPEHEREHGAKVFWLRARFNDYWQPTLQGDGPHAAKRYMDFIKKVYLLLYQCSAGSFRNRHHSDGVPQPPA